MPVRPRSYLPNRKSVTRELVESMSASEINKRLDVLDKESSKITDEFIAAGRGHERPSETYRMTDPLAMRAIQNWKDARLLHGEIARRYGPGAPSRLPSGSKTIRAARRNTVAKPTARHKSSSRIAPKSLLQQANQEKKSAGFYGPTARQYHFHMRNYHVLMESYLHNKMGIPLEHPRVAAHTEKWMHHQRAESTARVGRFRVK